jgi:hypothetical protein
MVDETDAGCESAGGGTVDRMGDRQDGAVGGTGGWEAGGGTVDRTIDGKG